jgi:hypothetical protein
LRPRIDAGTIVGAATAAPSAADVRRKNRRRDKTREDFIRKRKIKGRAARVEGEGVEEG